jgi:hypothetical protein
VRRAKPTKAHRQAFEAWVSAALEEFTAELDDEARAAANAAALERALDRTRCSETQRLLARVMAR